MHNPVQIEQEPYSQVLAGTKSLGKGGSNWPWICTGDYDSAWVASETDARYDLLEREDTPEFCTRDEQGTPAARVKRMRKSMSQLTPKFSANRTVGEYTEQHDLPAASVYLGRASEWKCSACAAIGGLSQRLRLSR